MIKYVCLILVFAFLSCSKNTPIDKIPNSEMEIDSTGNDPQEEPMAHIMEIAQFPNIINECSGLIKIENRIISMNDGSNHTLIQEIDPATAEIIATINISNIDNIDWEAIKFSNNNIYIADSGNNEGDRENLSLYTIPYQNSNELLCIDTINFIWPDQTSFSPSNAHPFDCESLLMMGDTAIFFTKNRNDLKSNVYRLNISTEEIIKGETINITGLSTDAEYDPSGDVILLSYLTLNGSDFANKINIIESVDGIFQLKESIAIPQTTQIEAIVHLEDHKYLLGAESESSEGGFLYSLDLSEYYQ